MNTEDLKKYLSKEYQGSQSFLENIIYPIFGEEEFVDGYETEILDSYPEYRRMADATGIRSVKDVGMIYIDGEPLQIFDISVSDHIMMERNRVTIQSLVRRIMDQYSNAFMLFHYEDTTQWNWRFTYCHKSTNKEESTDSKRYTFLLGPGQSCRTAADNFVNLYKNRNNLTLKNIEDAFNVEVLSKEFFDKYKDEYEAFVKYMRNPANGMRQDFIDTEFDHQGMTKEQIRDREEKPIRDYVKKLLGRIVFLHFLQKKGWLGVPANGEWGTGDHDFMLKLFNNASEKQKGNFLDDILEKLFSKGLDQNRSEIGDIFDTGVEGFRNCRIPYLNGGLFERDYLDKKKSHFPAQYFERLMTMLSQYNFTIDENDPNDAEVGVDPEMLGRIFENLLEDNKDKGAFYTPKEIVQYMSRESLIAYLQTDQQEEDKARIRQFVVTHDGELLGNLKDAVDQKLINVKICDPAIGSGAFPMGLLRELFLCRSAIEPNIVENAAKIKRHIIQNNIYGVDLERGAVDIARLRFWLSLIVDEKSPEALPNLDFKIMQGNSLLESYEGFDLRDVAGSGSHSGQLIFDDDTCNRALVQEHIRRYFEIDDHAERILLRKKIDMAVKNLIVANNPSLEKKVKVLDLQNNTKFFLWHTYFKDVFTRSSDNGFDIVIGNPPYGAKYDNQTKRYYKNTYLTANSIKGIQKGSLDTYTLFIELGFNLLRRNGCFAYIVPISLTSSESLTGVHRMLMGNCNTIHISSYAVRPKPVFENAVVNTSILLFQKTGTSCQHLYSTKMHRRGSKFDLKSLIDNLQFVDVNGLTLYGRIPKISSEIEKNILRKVFAQTRLSTLIRDTGSPIVYRFAGGRYFKVVTNYSCGSSAERTIFFSNKKIASAVGCILSSNLSFWFYQIFSDNLNWKSYEIENFTIPNLSDENINELNEIYSRYLKDIEKNANIRTSSGRSAYNVESFKEYKIVRSKHIIDEIDDYICPLYGLTDEERDFVKNYELEFRMAGDD